MTKEDLLRALEPLADECVILVDVHSGYIGLCELDIAEYQNIDGEGFLVLIPGDT
jgi:hypothetical protein